MNWRGRPLTSQEVIIETIGAVATTTGLTVRAALDTDTYPKGIRIPDQEMKAFEASHLRRHQFHGDWNYTIIGAPADDPTRPNNPK
jgi:Rhodopirellula transposase DDE domain